MNNNKSINYLYNDNNILKHSRNVNNKINNTFFNYSNFPSEGYKSNQKLFKNEYLINSSAYTPKVPEINRNKSHQIGEEEKVNSDAEKYISSLNNQIYKLESQIEQLERKVI